MKYMSKNEAFIFGKTLEEFINESNEFSKKLNSAFELSGDKKETKQTIKISQNTRHNIISGRDVILTLGGVEICGVINVDIGNINVNEPVKAVIECYVTLGSIDEVSK